ncbi:MAG TPA: efflux RND transporter permease subunit, partial [Quisquiliibacterium sp.]|nr:efflux RND transporter permease subunit [Quisquiliibacterium sp.]
MSAPRPGAGFNLSAQAIARPQLTLFFILVVALAGAAAFFQLGQREDPDFTFRAMVIRTLWPGATTEQVDRQITDRIEKKLQETPYFKWTRSYSKPGESLIVLELLDTAPAKEVPQIWYQVRKKVGDIRATLPAEVVGPFYNDEFGDVFGTIYAFTGDGLSPARLRDAVEDVRQELLRLPNVQKIELVGTVDERIYVELSPQTLATLGIDPTQIASQLQAQNVVAPAGAVQGDARAVPLRVTGQFDSVADVQALRLGVGGRSLRLGDIARVTRGYADPPVSTMRFKGRQAIGLAVSMTPRGDVLQLGRDLDAEMQRLRADLPVGIEYAKVSDQPRIVKDAVGLFMRSLLEAVAIVLAVSFLSLGLRAGTVVALTIPLVLAGTFLVMAYFGIDLHRISTGALVIALGLLVDDAMIAVEMMARKIEEGFDTFAAATFAYTSTAFPMLTGTLITAAGFLPIATARSTTGEYTFAIF